MKVIQFYDDYTYQHSVGVMAISLFLAKNLEEDGARSFTAKEKMTLALGALLHDFRMRFCVKSRKPAWGLQLRSFFNYTEKLVLGFSEMFGGSTKTDNRVTFPACV